MILTNAGFVWSVMTMTMVLSFHFKFFLFAHTIVWIVFKSSTVFGKMLKWKWKCMTNFGAVKTNLKSKRARTFPGFFSCFFFFCFVWYDPFKCNPNRQINFIYSSMNVNQINGNTHTTKCKMYTPSKQAAGRIDDTKIMKKISIFFLTRCLRRFPRFIWVENFYSNKLSLAAYNRTSLFNSFNLHGVRFYHTVSDIGILSTKCTSLK